MCIVEVGKCFFLSLFFFTCLFKSSDIPIRRLISILKNKGLRSKTKFWSSIQKVIYHLTGLPVGQLSLHCCPPHWLRGYLECTAIIWQLSVPWHLPAWCFSKVPTGSEGVQCTSVYHWKHSGISTDGTFIMLF